MGCASVVVGLGAGAAAGYLAVRYASRLLEGRVEKRWAPQASTFCVCLVLGICVSFSLIAHLGLSLAYVELMGLTCVLLAISITDLVAWVIPNDAVVIAILLRVGYLAASFFRDGPDQAFSAFVDGAKGMLVIAALVGLTAVVLMAISGTSPLGGGDLKLLLALAFHVGWRCTVLLVLLACVFGVVGYPLVHRVGSHGEKSGTFPFGPAISLACWLTVLYGNDVVNWYLALMP